MNEFLFFMINGFKIAIVAIIYLKNCLVELIITETQNRRDIFK